MLSNSGSFKGSITAHSLFFYGSILALSGIWLEIAIRGLLAEAWVPELTALFTVYALTEIFQARFSSHVLEQIENQVQNANSEIKKTILDSMEFTYIGDPAEALEYCARQLRHAKRVKETYLRACPDEVLPSLHQTRGLYDGYTRVIEGGGFVDLIVSIDNFSFSYEQITGAKEAAGRRGTPQQLKLFTVGNGVIPIPNVLIITYESSAREVLFGWNFDNNDHGVVFSSKDERAIRYFDSWFEALKGGASRSLTVDQPGKSAEK